MSAANKELSRRFTELFSTGDELLADEILSPDVVFHGTAGDGELHGLDGLKAFVAGYRRAFPDARSSVEDQVAEDDKVVTRWRARGTHRGQLGSIAATGRRFEMDGVTIERIAGGKIAEVWVARDELGLLGQLGRLPGQDAPTRAGRA
jgi:steroid delta-isomerase-like uncharacterized protein